MGDIITEVRSLVEEECNSRDHFDEFFDHHVVPVVTLAEKLAVKIGADLEIVTVSALLHDIGIIRRLKGGKHAYRGAQEADSILRGFGYPEDRIRLVHRCIRAHSDGLSSLPEAECLYWADTMSVITGLPYYLAILSLSEYDGEAVKEKARKKILESWDSLPDLAKDMIREEYESTAKVVGIEAGQPRGT